MKYVRTKDNKIYMVVQVNETTYMTTKGQYIKRFEITKIADTIEELCDYVVVFHINGKITFDELKWQDKKAEVKQVIKWENEKSIKELKLAILTDKGLIYVAKMNEKGELELL